MFWPVLHSALCQECVILGSLKPIRLPSRLARITRQMVSTAVWVLRQDDNRCILLGTHPSLHQSFYRSTVSARLAPRRAARENGCGKYTQHPSSLHFGTSFGVPPHSSSSVQGDF